jgi:hypothetical protein
MSKPKNTSWIERFTERLAMGLIQCAGKKIQRLPIEFEYVLSVV